MKKFTQLREALKKGEQGKKLPDPPPMIVLKRKGYRTFPNGELVALYHNDMLKLDVSVPFSAAKTLGYGTFKEQVEYDNLILNETIVKKLESIVRNGMQSNVELANGATATVQPTTAQKILDLYNHNQLHFANRVKLSRYMSNDPKSFKKVVDFVSQN